MDARPGLAEENAYAPGPEAGSRRPLLLFLAALLGLALVKVALGIVAVPQAALLPVTVLITVLFIAIPVYALFHAASIEWTPRLGILLILTGVAVHVGLKYLGFSILGGRGWGAGLAIALGDVGFFAWCVGLGALLASLLREKNLLIPVSIFLAAFDIFLVLTPIGPVKRILQVAPEIPEAVALQVPQASAAPTGGAAAPFAFIGPADFIFMAMFFIALFRFGMNARATALALAPAILAYLLLAILLGPIPMLVPIGITVLVVNWKEFRLTGQEWASTALIAAIAGGLIWWGATRPEPPAEPLPGAGAPALPEPEGSPAPGDPGPPRS
jgi:hypothetical protein